MSNILLEKVTIAVVGLGYVGLPLASEFAKHYKVFGFDLNRDRVDQLNGGFDHTNEIDSKALKNVLLKKNKNEKGLFLTDNIDEIGNCNVFIITVPTPVDKHNRPDLGPLLKVSSMIAGVLKKGDTVIYESTVYPGVTEDECVPVLENESGLAYNIDFFAGYSPERINPGDKEHTVTKILKITSGSTPDTADFVDSLYRSIIIAGTHKAESIKIAEAAKVIENAQRDINIAFINELAMIFNKLGIDTNKVLNAASTKWNFLNFKPGLVGGHCIGVDPYYLAQKAQEVGYHPEIILAGRRVNDGMGAYVAEQLVKAMLSKGTAIAGSEVLILGFTFKENCPDVRNTKVIDIVKRLEEYQINVTIHDPLADSQQVHTTYGVRCQNGESKKKLYDGILLAVAHQQFYEMDLSRMCKKNTVVYDIKYALPQAMVDVRL
ncbi:UDP-N-acetyl-D-galactosamine dehydrogenase [Daejeonella rubra]|uniref:UDP-N-acetyl-D-galactosamine dehydrogenase n=1 Tax=Daejeonella rubra TaxID=990371 RepID=A0A1G9QQN3_9SPHI|nr:nucleotide sugar dehydrogenase [Daejeonella rubra]SDM13151.1 UDP-N-acetyl-D-galactosamine dehydrogenase [Daejeonella rubra]